jgi:hypothetical protein
MLLMNHNIFHSITIEYKGEHIDTHYGEWLDIWHEFNHTVTRKRCYEKINDNMFNLNETNLVRNCSEERHENNKKMRIL